MRKTKITKYDEPIEKLKQHYKKKYVSFIYLAIRVTIQFFVLEFTSARKGSISIPLA